MAVTHSPMSVEARLRAEVAAHRLEFDASQVDAAVRLDRLGTALKSPGSVRERLRKHLVWLTSASTAAAPLRGLYLWGGVGRGKTMLMDSFYEALRFSRRERCHYYRFMRGVHAELRSLKSRTQPLETVAQRLSQHSRIICLDEFFVADIADAMILSGLLAGLFRRGVTLVATSNTPPDDLYRDGLQRERFLPAIELIKKHVDVLHLDGGVDYRLRQLEQAPTYLDSAREDASVQLRQRFAALAGASIQGPSQLIVEDRAIAAVARGAGMVWFEFNELCEGPRSQNDYIELARTFHTIFISNIPEFTWRNENAARRFVMLIDEFYDRNVKIVVSAAAAPAALYHGDGERLQFDFQRASSRLVEMQTQHYLASPHRP